MENTEFDAKPFSILFSLFVCSLPGMQGHCSYEIGAVKLYMLSCSCVALLQFYIIFDRKSRTLWPHRRRMRSETRTQKVYRSAQSALKSPIKRTNGCVYFSKWKTVCTSFHIKWMRRSTTVNWFWWMEIKTAFDWEARRNKNFAKERKKMRRKPIPVV